MQTDLIIVSEYCRISNIEPSFLEDLDDDGLIKIENVDGEKYLLKSQLDQVERYARLHYDLSINMEGLDAIHNLLDRIEDMQSEIDKLRRRLKYYEQNNIL